MELKIIGDDSHFTEEMKKQVFSIIKFMKDFVLEEYHPFAVSKALVSILANMISCTEHPEDLLEIVIRQLKKTVISYLEEQENQEEEEQ